MPSEDRSAWLREIGDKLWRISLDHQRAINFEVRRKLASMAQEFEELAASLERKMAAD